MKLIIIGAGYVGLPLAISFSKYYDVICYDIDKKRINELRMGLDCTNQHSKREILNKRLLFTNNKNSILNQLCYIVTVPTPITKKNNPNLKMLSEASKIVGKSIKKNSLIVFESTTFPGCTEEFCIPIIERNSKLKFEKDFYVAYSPERVNPGDKINTLKNITKIVGANDKKTLRSAKKFYKLICNSIYPVESIKIAESAKVIENIQRDVNIALVNEFSILFNKLGIPNNKVLKAAATKWNFHYYKPGLVGGHCISVDPYYLSHKSREKNYIPKIILAGRNFNEGMGNYISNQTLNIMKKNNINLKKADIAILGFTFKENVPDVRNTKIEQIYNRLRKKTKKIRVFDSLASKSEVRKKFNFKLYDFENIKKFKYDAIILAVSHKIFLKKINFYNQFYKDKKNKIFIDIKNNFSNSDLKNNGFKYFQL